MQSLLQIASQVEAAVEAYNSVKPIPNLEEWVQHIEEEKAKAVRLFRDLRVTNGGASPALHPMLAALFMETFDHPLLSDINLSAINMKNPCIRKHSYYNPWAKFPDLPPPTGDLWWKSLAAKACQGKEAQPVDRPLPRVRLTLPLAPSGKEMEVDELTADDFILPIQIPKQGKSATAKASKSKKQKGALLPEPAVVK
ncbi:hypothetical protein EI94DRAFT_1804127 [Lactarius quietus]|nr:hypothetical protein EI94DRAFT_1804127 [Lactarius quietus]